jgi:hypothetical protein
MKRIESFLEHTEKLNISGVISSKSKINEDMNNKDIIYRLKSLISEWENEKENLDNMVRDWEEYDEPTSDPGLQYEQEMKVEECWNELSKFCKDNF